MLGISCCRRPKVVCLNGLAYWNEKRFPFMDRLRYCWWSRDIRSPVSTSNIIWEGEKVWSLGASWKLIYSWPPRTDTFVYTDCVLSTFTELGKPIQCPPQTDTPSVKHAEVIRGIAGVSFHLCQSVVRKVYVGIALIQGLLPMWEVYGMSSTFTHPREGHSNSRRMEHGRGRLATCHSDTFRNEHHHRKWTMNEMDIFSASHVSLPESCEVSNTKNNQQANLLYHFLHFFHQFSNLHSNLPTSKSTRNLSLRLSWGCTFDFFADAEFWWRIFEWFQKGWRSDPDNSWISCRWSLWGDHSKTSTFWFYLFIVSFCWFPGVGIYNFRIFWTSTGVFFSVGFWRWSQAYHRLKKVLLCKVIVPWLDLLPSSNLFRIVSTQDVSSQTPT